MEREVIQVLQCILNDSVEQTTPVTSEYKVLPKVLILLAYNPKIREMLTV